MTGSGVSIITNENDQSYNGAVYKINQHQKSNVEKLDSALNNASRNNEELNKGILDVNKSITNLNKQIYMNDALIVNWNKNQPFTYNTNLLS